MTERPPRSTAKAAAAEWIGARVVEEGCQIGRNMEKIREDQHIIKKERAFIISEF